MLRKLLASVLLCFASMVGTAHAQLGFGSNSPVVLPNGCGTANFNYGIGYLTTDPQGHLCSYSPQWNASRFVSLADSRMTNMIVGGAGIPGAVGWGGSNWFNVANALANYRYQYGVNLSGSGCRSDQVLTQANIAAAIADPAGWVIIGQLGINDIAPLTGNNQIYQGTCSVVAAGSWTTANTTIALPSGIPWLGAYTGYTVYDTTNSKIIGTIASYAGGVLTLSSAAAFASSGSTDSLNFLAPGNTASAYPFTNNNGVSVTSATVGQVAAQNMTNAALQIMAAGKRVVFVLEEGSNVMTQANIGQMYNENANLLAFQSAYPGQVFAVNPGPSKWLSTSSATALAFKAGYKVDGVHDTNLGAFATATVFNNNIQSQIPFYDELLANINDVNATNPRQLINNPLFQTQTGGTNSGSVCGLTGAVPANWTLVCGVGTTTVAITYPAEPNGIGSCVQLAITTAGADTVRLQSNAPSTGQWNLTDTFQFSANVTVAASSSNFGVFVNNAVNTTTPSNVTLNYWGNYFGTNTSSENGPTTAYSQTLMTQPGTITSGGTTKGFVLGVLYHYISAAGSGTATWCRAGLYRIPTYTPGSNTFSGWLLMRDINPASNDNSPAWLLQAG